MTKIDNVIESFKLSNEDMLDISNYGEIPSDLAGEDVFDYCMLFKNEEVAIKYCLEHSVNDDDTYDRIQNELHEDDILYMQGSDTRTAYVYIPGYSQLTELTNGIFILWKAY